MKKKTSWQGKLADSKDLPRVEHFDKKKGKNWPAGTYCLPAPIEVDAIMKKVPKGKLITINEIRQILAKKHKADFGCPITTGIFSWIAANAANEMENEGKKRITPYWRTLKTGGILNEKYPGGDDVIIAMPGDLDGGARQYISIDHIEYDDDAPWPAEPDSSGDSLNRIDENEYGNDVSNWESASPSAGQS